MSEKPVPNVTNSETVTLYRPVGPQELALIRESGYRAFPPRIPEQPIFWARVLLPAMVSSSP